MRTLIHTIMIDKKNGGVYAVLGALLLLASFVYGAALRVRRLLYGAGLLRAKRVPLLVISVGNLTVGGTGKTPFVIRLARILKDELSREVAVLIRGYGWDEQALLKATLVDIPVLVGEDRVRSAHRAIRLYGSDAAVLDDGFQYWELCRDLNIVLVDSLNPFGNGRLLPRGILREPISAISRADVVVFTKVDTRRSGLDRAKNDVRSFNKGALFIEAAHRSVRFCDERTKGDLPLAAVKGKRVVLLSSIGDPAYFEKTMADLGAEIVDHLAYADHYDYRERDREAIIERASRVGAEMVVTTEKDATKLRRMHLALGEHRLLTLIIEMDILEGRDELIARLRSLFSR